MTKQDDLSLLSPDVRGLVKAIDDLLWNAEQPNDAHYTWKSLRAELLRLVYEEARLHKAACEQLRRAQKAESELAAIKARIQSAPYLHETVTVCAVADGVLKLKGHRARVLVDDGDA